MKFSTVFSLVALLILTVAGVGYMSIGVLGMDPRRHHNTVTVELATSGGLMDTSQVTSRGMKIGKVEGIAVTAAGLDVTLSLDASHDIPVDSDVIVANLSVAGEQYLDIRPRRAGAPFLHDGSVIPVDRTVVSATVSETLGQVDSLVAQIDTGALSGLAATANSAVAGRDSEIDNLVDTFRLLALTLRDKNEEIRHLYDNAQQLGRQAYGYGPVLTDAGPWVGATGQGVSSLLQAFEQYSYVASDVWDDPIGPLITKIDSYLTPTSPDLALIATLLKPYTAPIEPLRVDAGKIIDMLGGAFPEGGPARVAVTIPN
ncbi:putative Mce family protein [Rhodococcus sp. AW25M09]|uniref:MlaD family protein n=1 Tax=Rhodococcus sp. AW25M09 TaxID=1268303 RepID=UPI0002AC678A|nr:MlaD family protein [Rhodococcus sp. AW25M09]CCQ15047.1 putative Mce family protein [Rhodococcus sp. AW25M09]